MNINFKTGHPHIDEHHEHLVELVTQLDSVIKTNKRKNLEPIITFLEDYSEDHFKEEEDIMQQSNYIGYSLHKAEHKKFKYLIKDLRLLYKNNKPTAHLIFFIRKIIDQLLMHIRTVDISIKNLQGD
tara:strand:- start:697 stop:1077 length:381 start_codon:yes stop_codon:yes gene_type:complete